MSILSMESYDCQAGLANLKRFLCEWLRYNRRDMRKQLFFDSNQNKYIVLTAIFILFWYFNYCFPLIWDDYVYSYIFEAKSFQEPLPATAQRVSCFKDILISQWNHYFFWGGRTVAHFLAQFFLWQGKSIFNIANAICFLFLLLEMQWIIDKGKISLEFKAKDIFWLFSLFWIFSAFCINVLTWLTVSCNYLWTLAILLLFVLFYIHFLFTPDESFLINNYVLLFGLGVLAGWTNENTVCFVILALGYLLFSVKKHQLKVAISEKTFIRLLSGYVGLVLGYILLMFAPGNFMRYNVMLSDGIIVTGFPLLKANIKTLGVILTARFLLYCYVLRGFFSLRKFYSKFDIIDKKYFWVSIVFLLLSIGSLSSMIFSPEFRWRSSFSSLVFLLVACGMVRDLRSSVVIASVSSAKLSKVIRFVMRVYVVSTVLFSIYVYSISKLQNNIMMEQIAAEKRNPTNQILLIKEGSAFVEKNFLFCFFATGGHLPYVYTLTQNENHWINRNIALYYGIKGLKQYNKIGKQ